MDRRRTRAADRVTYSVKEIFLTLQGEGGQAGRAAVFCRFSGCNLWSGREEDRARAVCRFCDTDFVGTDGTGGGKFATAVDLARAAVTARSSAVASGGLSTEWAVCAQRANARDFLRWIWPTMCQCNSEAPRNRASSAIFADASCSRDSPTDRQPNRDKIATSVAGKNFVIGKSSISPTLRADASAAIASRDRTAANACVNSDSRSRWLPPFSRAGAPATTALTPSRRARPGARSGHRGDD